MSGKVEKAKRRLKKIQATRFANELDKREVERWNAYKKTNPSAKCNADFQTKVEKYDT